MPSHLFWVFPPKSIINDYAVENALAGLSGHYFQVHDYTGNSCLNEVVETVYDPNDYENEPYETKLVHSH